jgi:hypothetical protein
MGRQVWGVVLVAAVVTCVASTVRAQPSNPDTELERGAELASQEKFEAAVTVWLGVLDELKGDSRAKAYKYLGVAFKRMGMLPRLDPKSRARTGPGRVGGAVGADGGRVGGGRRGVQASLAVASGAIGPAVWRGEGRSCRGGRHPPVGQVASILSERAMRGG